LTRVNLVGQNCKGGISNLGALEHPKKIKHPKKACCTSTNSLNFSLSIFKIVMSSFEQSCTYYTVLTL
jgi:hypothetical protein